MATPPNPDSCYVISVTAAGTHYRTESDRNSSIEEVIAAWRAAALVTSPVGGVAIGLAFAALVVLFISPLLLIPIAVCGAVLLVWLHQRAKAASVAPVLYQFDAAAQSVFTSLGDGIAWLHNSSAVWRVTHEEPAQRPANTTSVTRDGTVITTGPVPNLRMNIHVPAIAAAGETLMFFPDVLLVRRGSSFAAVPYTSLRVECETMTFLEPSMPPGDSRHVGNAWHYANKDGSPDRRRAGNMQIPMLEYGRVVLSWRGSGWVLLVSNMEAARRFASAVKEMAHFRISFSVRQSNDLEAQLQASIDRKRRLADLEERAAKAAAQVAAQVAANANELWIPKGSAATVHGLTTGDLVYVGSRLPHLDGHGVEPALIDPSLPIDLTAPNTSGAGMTYWPSYSDITPASRAAYLQWLAGERKDPQVYIGYVFVFFYGLERRVYEFIRERGSSADEVLDIAREVARLLDQHAPRSHSFAAYGDALLDLIGAIEPRARSIPRQDPIRAGYGLPSRLRVALGERSLAGQPIPAALAYEWVRGMESMPTPAVRCEQEFELLFHIRYAKRFGDGLVIKPNKTRVDVTYRPASSALEALTMRRELPDVGQLTRPLAKLSELAAECCGALDPFSRFLGRNPDARESLAAFALLPEELVEGTHSLDAAALASLVQSRINEKGLARLSADELLAFIRVAKPDKVAKGEAVLLAQALEKLGYGMEPDVRLGGPSFEPGVPLILFRRLSDCPSAASDEYALAAVCMRLGVIVSASDDDMSEEERALLEQHIAETLRLSAGERQRLAANLAWLVDAKLGTAGMKKRIEAISDDGRRHVGNLLIDIAMTDGRVDPREMKMLEKLYALLELPPADLYRDVHAASAADDEPVVVHEPAVTAKGFAIPPPRRASGGKLDMSRVHLKIAETRQVASLLGGVFAEAETTIAVAREIHGGSATIGSLDAAHSELLRRLAERESWPREEVERLAAGLSLLPDGALETINDYAYSTADEPFWEDDDPLTINSRVAMELMQ